MTIGVVEPEAVLVLEWKCGLDLVTVKDETRVGIFIGLEKQLPELDNCQAKVQFQIADKEKGQDFLDTIFLIDQKIQTTRTPRKDMYSTLPRQCENTPFLTDDGALEIRVTVTFFLPGDQNVEVAAMKAQYQDWFKGTLACQLTAIRRNPLNISSTATKLVSKDGVQFPVDRVILAARSTVFRAMFRNQDSEDTFELNEIDSKPLEVLLHFLHTAELRETWGNEGIIEGLVYGAHKYGIRNLVVFLDNTVGLECTHGNCGRLMGLAKKFGMKTAQKQLLGYFKQNLVGSIDEILKFAEETANVATSRAPPLSELQEEQENGEVVPCKKERLTEASRNNTD